mmetsp:Transcript_2668/g.8946  ORF Transcript_2668/g.8946 Transcript_2668/m.8946 type:complete len:241 (-) Transcript_2668:7-729(-)
MLEMMPRASRCSSLSPSRRRLARAKGVSLERVMMFGSALSSRSLNASGRQASAQAMHRGVHPSSERGELRSMPPLALPSMSSCTMRHASLKLSRVATSQTRWIACASCSCRRGTPQRTSSCTSSNETALRACTTACSTKAWRNSPSSASATTRRSSSMSPSLAAETRARDVLKASCRAMGSSARSRFIRSSSSSGSSINARGHSAKDAIRLRRGPRGQMRKCGSAARMAHPPPCRSRSCG